jgi:ABC-type cobalt transport system, ATPase component
MSIVLEDVCHTYLAGSKQTVQALDHVSLTIESGRFVCVIGQTGSGKSTLIQHFNALMVPESGRVLVDGLDAADKKSRRELRRRVGMVFQYPEYQLFAETVAEDIAFGPKNLGTPLEEIDACVRRAMAETGLSYDDLAARSPFELSGGQKRRVALAGILATDPDYLVLDEPMAGLDPVGRREILDFLRRYHECGKTVIMVSHSMDDVAEMAEQVIVMNEGKLAMMGTPEGVFLRRDELRALHLDVPQAALMVALLRERGVAIDETVVNHAGLLAALKEVRHV